MYRTSSNLSTNDEAENDSNSAGEGTADVTGCSSHEKSPGSAYAHFKPRNTKSEVNVVEEKILQLLQRFSKWSKPENCGDKCFFESLYEDFQGLPEQIKLPTKMQLMQLTTDLKIMLKCRIYI